MACTRGRSSAQSRVPPWKKDAVTDRFALLPWVSIVASGHDALSASRLSLVLVSLARRGVGGLWGQRSPDDRPGRGSGGVHLL